MRDPLVSVVMPTFNNEQFLLDAIQSVMTQVFENFELIVVNDGSTDSTEQILERVQDCRLRVVSHASNMGLAVARNSGLHEARGQYIAWLDSDDLSRPTRLVHQVNVLERRPEVGLVGSWVRTFGSGRSKTWRYPRSPRYARARMPFDDPLATSSVMMRTQVLEDVGTAFRDRFAPAEDYDLWERISRSWGVMCIPRVLTEYRIHDRQTSVLESVKQVAAVREIQARQISRLGVTMTDRDWALHKLIGVGWGVGVSAQDLLPAEEWLTRLRDANELTSIFDGRAFDLVTAQRLRIVKNSIRRSPLLRMRNRLHNLLH